VDETACAAKIIYSAIAFGSNVGIQHVKELSLQANLRHPNIVQFLGICQLPGSSLPALVTELMDSSLHKFLVDPNMKDAVPISHKKSILEDVTRGLIYLHKNEIVHRDLTANNVLLTPSLVAKIADLGNSRFLPKEDFVKLTSRPGTVVYMPPEAFTKDYTHKLDIFSFGHLVLFTMIQVSEKITDKKYCALSMQLL
jgi:serine/threonine protein kinase